MTSGFRNFANDISEKQTKVGGVPTFENFKRDYQPPAKASAKQAVASGEGN
jgi:hypothetical protein